MTAHQPQPFAPKLRFSQFAQGPGWRHATVAELVTTVMPPKKLPASTYLADGRFPIMDQSQRYICGWTNDEAAIIKRPLPVIIFGDHTCVLKLVNRPFAQGADGVKILTATKGVSISYLYHQLTCRPVVAEEYKRHFSALQAQVVCFPEPQSGEQQRIVDCLDSLDDLITADMRTLAALRKHKQGLMRKLFPKAGETAPQLRFPEFRNSSAWETAALGTLLVRPPEYGANAPAVPFSKDLPAYIRITDIDDDGRFVPAPRTSVDIEPNADQLLQPGDVVFARTGASVGKSHHHLGGGGPLVFAGFLIRARPNPQRLSPQFLSTYLSTDGYWAWVRMTSARSGPPGINSAEYASMPIPLPPDGRDLAEQHKIAHFFRSMDDLIEAAVRRIAALRKHKQGLMRKLFPRPCAPAPRLRFPDFRDEPAWLTPSFADLYRFKRTSTLSRNQLNYETGSIRNIHYGDIHTKFKPLFRVGDEHVPYVNPDTADHGFPDDAFCDEGDIVLADASEYLDDVGKAIEVVDLDGERVVAGTHTMLATRRGAVPVPGFGGQLLQSVAVRAGIRKESHGAKVHGISATRLSAVLMPMPPTAEEQRKIATCLGSLDDMVTAEARKIAALRKHKQGLMRKLFPKAGATAPRLRFAAFLDAAGWRSVRCRDIATVLTGYGFPNKFQGRKKGQYPFYKVSDISQTVEQGQRFISEANHYVDADVLDEIRAKPVPAGTIIFAKIGEAIRSNRRVTTTQPAVIDNNTAGVKAMPSKVSDEFMLRLWSNVSLIDHAGGVVPAVSKSAIENVPLCYPIDPVAQRRIAGCLDSVDDLISAQKRHLAALRHHKQGLLQQLFPSFQSGSAITGSDST